MSMDKLEYQQRMQAIQRSYLASLGLVVVEFRELWSEWKSSHGDERRLRALKDRAHKLAGSANTFQLPALASAARGLQAWFDEVSPEQVEIAQSVFEDKLFQLNQLIDEAVAGQKQSA